MIYLKVTLAAGPLPENYALYIKRFAVDLQRPAALSAPDLYYISRFDIIGPGPGKRKNKKNDRSCGNTY